MMPPVTKNLIIINVLFYLGTIVGDLYGIDLNDILGLHFFLADKFNPAQLFTYMFMHGSWSHLFFNMFAVWMFGRTLETVWGPRRFLFYYILCGVGAALFNMLVVYFRINSVESGLSPEMLAEVYKNGADLISNKQNYVNPLLAEFNGLLNQTMVGASGAVYAILLAFGMLFPNQQLFIFPIPVPIKAKYFVIGYALLELYLGLSNNASDNVAHFAHLGGMIFGFVLIMYWRKKNRNNGTYYN